MFVHGIPEFLWGALPEQLKRGVERPKGEACEAHACCSPPEALPPLRLGWRLPRHWSRNSSSGHMIGAYGSSQQLPSCLPALPLANVQAG